MEKPRDTPERPALSAFAAAGRAKEKVGVIFHEEISVIPQNCVLAQSLKWAH
jgi:hypothetical protein